MTFEPAKSAGVTLSFPTMPASMATLAQLVEAVGPPVLHVHAAPRGLDIPVRAVTVYDPADPTPCGAADLVVLVGLPPGSVPAGVLQALAEDGATAALVKGRPDVDAATVRAAESAGMALLSVPAGSSWGGVLTWLQSLVVEGALEQRRPPLGGLVTGDLFALANAIAAVMEAPITIEDPQLRVLAFSGRQEEGDRARLGTILGQKTPEPYLQRMRDQGVLRRIYASPRPVYVRGLPPDVLPRIAVAVRAGHEVLGVIWVVVHERPSRQRMALLADAASAASLHLLYHRLVGDARRELRTELVSSVLNGEPLAAEAARRLGLETRCQVVAVGVAGDDAAAEERIARLSRAWELLDLHVSALYPSARTALLRGTVYGLLPAATRTAASGVRAVMQQYVERAGPVLGPRLRVGIGERAAGLDEIPRSRRQADAALRVLLLPAPRAGTGVAGLDETWQTSLLLRLEDACPDEVGAGRRVLERLRRHDSENGTRHAETVETWLRHFGDTAAVARELGVHDNTVRFRMRALRTAGLFEPDDPAARFGLSLLFRLEALPHRAPADAADAPTTSMRDAG